MNLLVAVPTFNRPTYIEELLLECGTICNVYGTDIIIYDSSDNEETRQIVQKYAEILPNLYYINIDSKLESNQKFIMIMQGYGWVRSYDYVWLWGDSLRFLDGAFQLVGRYIEQNADIIIADIMNSEHLSTIKYISRQKLFDLFNINILLKIMNLKNACLKQPS